MLAFEMINHLKFKTRDSNNLKWRLIWYSKCKMMMTLGSRTNFEQNLQHYAKFLICCHISTVILFFGRFLIMIFHVLIRSYTIQGNKIAMNIIMFKVSDFINKSKIFKFNFLK